MKFHDQFFEQKGTKHDQLVAKVLEKIDDVATLLCPVLAPEPHMHEWLYCPFTDKGCAFHKHYDNRVRCARFENCEDINLNGSLCYFPAYNHDTYLSVNADTNDFCCTHHLREPSRQTRVKKGVELIQDKTNNVLGALCNCDIITTYETKRPDHHTPYDCSYAFKNANRKLKTTHNYTEHNRALTKETEHIFYGYNRFILGFGDVILDITDDFTAFNGDTEISHEQEFSTFVIDCKPKLEDMGSVARQIKTYAAELQRKRSTKVVKVIITCDYPSHSARVIAQNEEIVLVHYDNAMSRFSLITDDAIEVAAL